MTCEVASSHQIVRVTRRHARWLTGTSGSGPMPGHSCGGLSSSMNRLLVLSALPTWLFLPLPLHAEDRPQWGEAFSRNMISPEKLLIDTFDPKAKSQVKWCVP